MNPLTAIGKKDVSSLPTSSPAEADADSQRRFEQAITSHAANTRQSTTRRTEQPLTNTTTNNKPADQHATHDSDEELPLFDSSQLAIDDPRKQALSLTGHGMPAPLQNQKKNVSSPAHRFNEIANEIRESLSAPEVPTRQPNLNTLTDSGLKPVDITVTSHLDTAMIPVQQDINDERAYQTPSRSPSQPDTQHGAIPHQQTDPTLPIPARHANEINSAEGKTLDEIETSHLLVLKPKESDSQSSYSGGSDGKAPFFPQTQLLPGERILATMQAASTLSPLLEALIDKLSVEISIELTQQKRPATLHLTLPSLGALEIQLTSEHGKLQIEILANPAAQQLLKQARFELIERLQLLYPTQTVELSLPSQTDSEHGSRQRRSVYEEWKKDA
ncbi:MULTISPECIES: type III secretion system needle length determinant [unclassified Photorhabdus]|uniref:type III secretion system needle length determinant n=1 Tax=unclassified Photorhabdus TaxID=2620880 RepID=UPI000DCDEEEF|nr:MULTISPECIES: type III secretion system needle length determinant [unclassified Photorhabdus]RAW95034.1 type III secretion system needle length determinant [Photorhabdus sp. S9-53]RAW95182.1 type III secretion system needle length determinant [Photorhabdus sp. S10-54]RAW99374.1 type III secretion system needle length determinant [Photorhabdus sp. S8-52]